MNAIVLKDLPKDYLFPFSLTRSILDIRVGILTLRQKWEILSGCSIHLKDEARIPSNIIPSANTIQSIREGHFDISKERFLAYPWQLFQMTDAGIRQDFSLLTQGKNSQPVSSTNQTILPDQLFIEPGAKIEHTILNASTGPIYISKNAVIMEGSLIRGPFYLGEESVVKMGTKIYGATSVGKKCVIGGEIKNSVIFDFTNKAHDGYIGDSVIGAWCNLGAGSSNSNIKNNASDIKIWHEPTRQFLSTGIKCGLIMGDYSRSAINTSFNTGTITGICCNLFGEGLSPKFIPSFSWGFDGIKKYELEKAIQDINNWKKLKNELSTDIEIQNLKHIFENY